MPLSARFDQARRHLGRARREGVGRVVRHDANRVGDAFRTFRWGLVNGVEPNAVPVYIVGIQRSGTDMLINSLRRCPEVRVYNESRESKAFRGFKLRDDAVIRELVRRSRQRCVVFKSLWDSHRVVHLIEGLGAPQKGRAIWTMRSVEGRVRSVLALWPDHDRRVLHQLASGQREPLGLTTDLLAFIRSFNYEQMTTASGAALLWYVRNRLYFDLALDEREDVSLVSYERVLADPPGAVSRLARFLSVSYETRMSDHIDVRPPALQGDLDIDPTIAARCRELEARFTAVLDRAAQAAA